MKAESIILDSFCFYPNERELAGDWNAAVCQPIVPGAESKSRAFVETDG
jgi:hypothetical protein